MTRTRGVRSCWGRRWLEVAVGRREASVGLRQVVVAVVVVGAVVVGSEAATQLADSASRSFRYNLVVHTFFQLSKSCIPNFKTNKTIHCS